MSVVVLDHSAELGGAEIGLATMARELDGLHVVLLEDGPLVERLADCPHPPVVLDLNRRIGSGLRDGVCGGWRRLPAFLAAARELRGSLLRVLDEVGSNVLVLNTLRSALLVCAARLPRDVRCVVMLRDSARPPYLSWIKSLVVHLGLNLVAHDVIANSRWTARQLATTAAVTVAPPFLDRGYFDAPPTAPPERVSRFLLLGRITAWKGQVLGLQALGPFLDSGRCSVTVAGGAWFGEEGYLAAVAAEAARHPPGAVRVVGHVDDVVGLIDAHDAVVHTALLPEPFGQVVAQAMARGRLVIAADAGGPAETVDDGHDGLLYRAGDVASLRSVVGDVLEWEQGRIAALCDRARRRSLDFHPARTAELISCVLRAVAVREPTAGRRTSATG